MALAACATATPGLSINWMNNSRSRENRKVKMNTVAKSDDQMVFITRVFDAPRELVFKAWTDAEHMKQWFAPNGCTIHIEKMDIRPGGSFHTCISNPSFGD